MARGRGRGRGRGRSRPRLSRMDAAVDAMLPFGFPEEKVKKRVKFLLKVYGGDEAWPFLEDCAYKVLLEHLLEESEDDEEQVEQNGDQLEDEKEEAAPPLPKPAATKRARVPCYGWIDSDEESGDDDFICLAPASTSFGAGATRGSTRRRTSRWDVKP